MVWPEIKGTKLLRVADMAGAGAALRCAALLLRTGGVVAFPTETVYGLGADARNAAAVQKIFVAKQRPADNPLIVHVAGIEQMRGLVREIPTRALLLAERFWPGPLTLILPKSTLLPEITTAGFFSVALRVPAHPLALALLEEAALPVAAPSANLSGTPSPTTADHVLTDLAGRIDAVLDGGACRVGVESTVLSLLSYPPAVLRPGGITVEMLRAVLGEVIDLSVDDDGYAGVPSAPGMKYRHYAPRVPLYLIEAGEKQRECLIALLADLQARGVRPGLLLTAETARSLPVGSFFPLEILGPRDDPAAMAQQLYGALRRLDNNTATDVIIAEGSAGKEMGRVLMNRLRKAAARVITTPLKQRDEGWGRKERKKR